MGKWTWAILFILSVSIAVYFFRGSKPGVEIVAPVNKLEVPTVPAIDEGTGGAGTSPLSGTNRPDEPAPPPFQAPIQPQQPPSGYNEPPQYEPPPPPPPPPQYTEPVEPFNANPPPFEPSPSDVEFPDGVPPPPPPQAFPEEEFD